MTDTMTDMLTDEKQLEFRLDGKPIIPYKWELKIWRDAYPENPRDLCNAGLFWTPERCDYARNELYVDGVERNCDMSDKELVNRVKAEYWMFPVSVLDHSGWRIWEGLPTDPWDSFQIGWYLVPKTLDGREMSQETARNRAKTEVEMLDSTFTGDVYGFTVYKDGEEFESCGGFYYTGEEADFLDEIRDNVENFAPDSDMTREQVKAAWDNLFNE
jgi:hypothetical protein